jgi:hypothetical protein
LVGVGRFGIVSEMAKLLAFAVTKSILMPIRNLRTTAAACRTVCCSDLSKRTKQAAISLQKTAASVA